MVVLCLSSCSTPKMLTEPERAAIRQSAARALPVGTSVQVNDCAGSRGKLDVTVTAHLLEGHSAEEKNPYVRGNYNTHEKLERLVRFRSAQVIKSILADGISERIGALIVETRHGVRTRFMGASARQDLATTLYSVRFPVTVETLAMGNAPNSEVASRFELLTNIIPQISIVAE